MMRGAVRACNPPMVPATNAQPSRMLANMRPSKAPRGPANNSLVVATLARGRSWAVANITPQLFSVGVVLFWSIVVAPYFAGDALTYLAAGERLNAGHPLYMLSPGDRIVQTSPPFFGPLLSPPLIAVVFRPIALGGLPAMWAWSAVLGLIIAITVWHLATTRRAATTVFLLGIGLGLAVVIGNISALLIPGYVLLWRFRARPQVGALIGVMGVTKLLPFVFVGFLISRRDFKAVGWCVLGAALALWVTVVGAGINNTLSYIGVARDAAPQPSSLPYLTGLHWLSPVLLAGGTLASAILGERASFRLCVITVVFGAPVLAFRETATLLALLAPSIGARLGRDEPKAFRWRPRNRLADL
jgi:hypothetical protein